MAHRDFGLALVREMLAWAGHELRPSRCVGRPALVSSNIGGLVTCHNQHWPGRCRVYSSRCV